MKQLNDDDIKQMITSEYTPDIKSVRRSVRHDLNLGELIPEPDIPTPKHITLDLHQLTEEQAWSEIINVVKSGAKTATIITGASGILKIKFQQWAQNSILSPYIKSITPINNGSFHIQINTNAIQN
jgi:hypothetical protein